MSFGEGLALASAAAGLLTLCGWFMRTWLRAELGIMRERIVALETKMERVMSDLWNGRRGGGTHR